MKKILVSAYACIPHMGSEEGTGWMYATMLSLNDLEVHCLTKKDGRAVIEPILAVGTYPNLTVHYVLLPPWVDRFCHANLAGMYFHYIYWQWSAWQLARKLARTHTFDLVHHVTYGSIQLGSFMYKLGKPFVFGPVGGGQRAPKALKRYFGSYWSREWMRDWVSTGLQYINPGFYGTLKAADLVIVANLDTMALARRLRPKKPIVRIWDMGLRKAFVPDRPIDRPIKAGEPLKLIWVGRMLPRKALELTIQALGSVDPALPVTLTIVGGKGEMADQVPHYIDRYGVAGRVHWAGHVTFEEMKAYYEQSDVLFFNSLRDTGPHQLLEAMAYSVPVITLDLHGQGELVNDTTGIRVAIHTEEQVVADLAKAVEWMYHHPQERQAMGRAGHTFAQAQVWETKIKLFIDDIYPGVLAASAKKKRRGAASVPAGQTPPLPAGDSAVEINPS